MSSLPALTSSSLLPNLQWLCLSSPSKGRIVIADPQQAAELVVDGFQAVKEYRIQHNDAYFFNWLLKIDREFQEPFVVTHESMSSLKLYKDQPLEAIALNLRCALSGIVGGNIRKSGIKLVEEHGPFELKGDPTIMRALDELLKTFVADRRMHIRGSASYVPCYRLSG